MVLSLLVHCSVACGGFVFVCFFVMQVYRMLSSLQFEDEKAGCVTSIVLLLHSKCSIPFLSCVGLKCVFSWSYTHFNSVLF